MNYEEYMRSVLGYSVPTNANIYSNMYDKNYEMSGNYNYVMPNMQEMQQGQENIIDLSEFYPEIYKLLNPMVCKICDKNSQREMTKELLEQMTNEIYDNFEVEEKQERAPLKNGDVRNPNAKEPEISSETRHRNFLLRDLIKILLLNNFRRPVMPPPPPPMRPNYGYPPQMNNNFMPPPPRPRYY